MKQTCPKQLGVILFVAFSGLLGLVLTIHGEEQSDAKDNAGDQKPMVLHVHHHYGGATTTGGQYIYVPHYRTYLGASTFAGQPEVLQRYSLFYPTASKAVLGGFIEPWKQDWLHLGFTGYLGQQGEISGLIVDTVTPDSPAAKMGLIPGDFILKINGAPLNSYRQVAVVFEETRENPKHEISFEIWNPHTRRKNTVRAILKDDKEKKSQ